MKKPLIRSLLMLSMISLIFTACKKDKPMLDDVNDIASVEENAQGDENFSDVFTSVSNFSVENDRNFTSNSKDALKTLSTDSISEEPIVTICPKGNNWPKTVIFDYGKGVINNKTTRKGKIIAVYSNKFKIKNATVTLTFENYTVNNTKIECTKTITNLGLNPQGNYIFSIIISGSKFNKDNIKFTYNANRTIEWIKGYNTNTIFDDEFAITGTSTGINSKGVSYTTNITSPLIKKTGWPYLVAGVIEILPENKYSRTLNYGNGELDAKATLTINGVSREFNLKK